MPINWGGASGIPMVSKRKCYTLGILSPERRQQRIQAILDGHDTCCEKGEEFIAGKAFKTDGLCTKS